MLGVSRNAAAARLSLACDLTGRLAGTLAALGRGEIDLVKARVVSDGVASLSDEQAAVVESRVLPRADGQTAAWVRAAVKRAVLRVDPTAAGRREAAARADRRVTMTLVSDGMAELWALLPAADAVAVYDRVDRLARACPAGERTADQRRADCFADLLLDGAQDAAVRVNVTVAASTLAGLDEEPGDLAGYGPVTAATARQLAAGALAGDTTWRRLLTDPVDGRVLDVGRRCYRPPAGLADLVRARDRTCRFPGCRLPADRCDLDHTVRYPNGPTSVANLGAACRRHHRLKHETDWRVVQDQHGVFTWTSPAGRRHLTHPERPLDTTPGPGAANVPAKPGHQGAADRPGDGRNYPASDPDP